MKILEPVGADLDDDAVRELYTVGPGRHVRANFVQSLDAAIEMSGRSGRLGGPSDRHLFLFLRSLSDVVLVGAGTVRAENYGPASIDAPLQAARRERGQAPVPPIAVVTASANLDPSSRLFQVGDGQPRPIIITCAAADADRCAGLSEVADVVICGDGAVDITVAVDTLADLGLGQVLCEGGPTLLNQLITQGLLDDLCLTLSPLIAGPGPRLLSAGFPLTDPLSLRLGHVLIGDGLLMTRYVVEREA